MSKKPLIPADEKIDWVKSSPFFIAHFVPLAAFFTGVHWSDVILCISLYWIRMFFITAGYHRYFSHRSYKLGRVMQFLMALGATTSAQKGPLWWASNHRHHHRYSDQPEDIHSPKKGFFWSHMGWILCDKYHNTDLTQIPDFAKYPELRWLNKWHLVPPIALASLILIFGGWSALVIGFFLSTILVWHCTFFINSLAHVFGRRRFVTTDTSRNSFLLALITLGEGWHNNHHHFQASTNQGFYWWEIDVSYYVLKVFHFFGLASDLRTPPESALKRNLIKDGHLDIGMLKELPAKAMEALAHTAQQAKGVITDVTEQAAATLADAKRKATDAIADLSAPVSLVPTKE